MKKKRKFKIKKILSFLFSLVCIFGIVYSLYHIFIWKNNVDNNKKIKNKIDDLITVKKDKYDIDFKKLKEENKDTVLYLKVNNTSISYVAVKGADNSYYLKHNFNKEYNVAGWVFVDYRNKLDGTDKNIIIYGHNMRDGSMFGTLKNVLNKDWQENEDNHIVTIVTESKVIKYKVFSSYSIEPEEYYITTGFEGDEEYTKFLKTIKSRSVYDYDTKVTKDDTILTLSTCTNNGTKRVVLHAKKIKEE